MQVHNIIHNNGIIDFKYISKLISLFDLFSLFQNKYKLHYLQTNKKPTIEIKNFSNKKQMFSCIEEAII